MMYLRYSKVKHGLLIDAEDSVSERKMTKQRNREAKKLEVNLNYLRNDLDIWQHRVQSWLHAKSKPQQNEIDKFGIEVVQKLCTRKVLNIYGMKFPELPLTPRRSRSVSPNRPTTPESASRRSKSITRDSPKDRHHDCQKKLDLDDDEDGYKVDAYTNPATCTCAHDETFYKCRLSLLEKQRIELEKEVRRLESLATDYIAKFRDLKNMMDSRKMDACPDCEMKEQHMQRYKAERNELKIDRQRLEKLLTNLAGERNDLAQKLQKIVLDNAKLEDKNQNLESHSSSVGGGSDTKKENISLRSELTEALKSLEKLRQEHNDLTENKEETSKLLKDNAGLKDNLQNLSKQLNELENRVVLSDEETSKLIKDNTELKDNLKNLSQQLKESENRVKLSKEETSKLQIHNIELKDNLQNLSKQLKESENGVMLSKEETSKLKKDNAELKDNLQHLSKQLKESENRVLLSKEETSKLHKDHAELKDNLQNLSKQLKESENRVMFSKEETSKLQEENAELKDNLKNLSKQLKEYENRVVFSKEETSKLQKDNAELKDNLQNLSKQLKESENRLSEEGNDQTLEQIGKGSIIRAQTMINYDLLLAEKSEEVTKKVSELYEDKWEVAMIELGENGGKEKNIEFLLKILKNAYSFCECLEGRLTDGFEQAMVNAAANIKEVVDTTVFVRPILERLERCIIQLFFRQYSQYQEYRTKEPVYSYITEALSLSWFMVTRNPRVSISTTIPDESHPQFYDTYSTDGSEVDYVVLPMITWSTNKKKIIRKGIAAFK